MIKGTLDLQITKEYSLSTNSQMNFNAKNNILFSSKESTNETTLRTKGNLLFTSNASMGFETDTNATPIIFYQKQ